MSVDDDRQQLLEGQAAARRMISKNTAEKMAEMRDKACREFFGEQGVPPHLKEGWAVLDDLREKRMKIGYPMPPGGVLLFGYESVVAGCLAEMHTALSAMLGLSVDDIKLRLERDENGKLNPVADVKTPEGWILPTAKNPRQDPDEAVRDFLDVCTKRAAAEFKRVVDDRLACCDNIRADVRQPVASFG